MVTLKTVDRLVGLLIVGIILLGSYSWWRAAQRRLGRNGMMGEMMGTMPGMNPIWYLFGTLIAVSIVLGAYIVSRNHLADIISGQDPVAIADKERPGQSVTEGDNGTRPSNVSSVGSDQFSPPAESTGNPPSALTFLPEDERRIIKPILESPGLTQVELRGRSGFSKAKVSQTVSKLEDRGLIYRERQGRTYRVFPGESLKEQ